MPGARHSKATLKVAGLPLLRYFAKMEQGDTGFALCFCVDPQYSRTNAMLFFKI